MTKEERRAARADRIRAEQEQYRRFPRVLINQHLEKRTDIWGQIRMAGGIEDLTITLRKKGEWEKEIEYPDVEYLELRLSPHRCPRTRSRTRPPL